MADTKTETKLEREYIIPLRNKWKRVPRYKKANKAIKAIKEFLVRHMKLRDNDLSKVKIDKYLNEEIWFRGIRKPPSKIKVKAIKEGDIVKVELAELPVNLKFKKLREEKIEAKSMEILESKKKTLDKLKEQTKKPEEKSEEKEEKTKEGEEKPEDKKDEKESEEKKEEANERPSDVIQKKEEAKEKKSAVVESTEKMEKELAKKTKHQTKQSKQPKRQQRKALAK